MQPGSLRILLCTALLLNSGIAGADALEVVNELRDGGCRGAPPAAPLTRSARLDQVAELFSQRAALGAALERGGYAAQQAAGIQIESRSLDDATIFEMLTDRFCSRVTDPDLVEAGFVQRSDQLWLVVGEPTNVMTRTEPSSPSSRDHAMDVIALVNEARARPRRCGNQQYPAVPPLQYSDKLSEASRAHAEDMADRGYFDHKSPEGTTPTQRLARTGYQWTLTGENIARGQMSADAAVQGWLASPGHCANIMEPRFSETGFALAEESGREGALYWVQTFAAPADPSAQNR